MKLFSHKRDAALRFGFQNRTNTFLFHTKEMAHKLGMSASSSHLGAFHSFSTSVFRAITQLTRQNFLRALRQLILQ